ncbi:MAG: pimeloyl-ACP methyl ester carboxylesterase [Myxococcota bacterium]|jgi:pimeloyl-ACP methyl ester carboxylesterase
MSSTTPALPTPSDPALTPLSVRRGDIAAAIEGQGPVVLAVHGLPGSHRDFRYLSAGLIDLCTLVRLDLPGFGDTPARLLRGNTVVERAQLLLEVLDALKAERAVILGHSMGAALACELAALAPDRVAGVALIAGPGPSPHHTYRRRRLALMGIALRIPGVARLLARRLREGYERAGFPTSMTHAQRVTSVVQAGVLDFERHGANMRGLTVPALCAWAADDRLIEPEVFLAQAEACPEGPRLRFETGGHNIQKTRSLELTQALREWIPTLL